ncbi:transposase [Nonomuraea gerenzanensis]|uniref:Transposase n=1 Tax=Nonomuraea gerenzanensis TaxID=93944 RepID=A0A1M4BKY4_9ACTN|nr:transposase [Nonomuraea gerenzanensis]UBU10047.1 transposase [Nonomuraea gerenzanensis]SAP16328.1 hypothetical protein BN4615_P10991 [Nonomuraea gerenzanensis]
MATWRGPDGIEIDVIVLNRSPLYRVTQKLNGRRYHLAYAHDIAGIERWVDLADLVEVLPFRARR